ncbi:MAG: EAL domain-containing protein [Selenomonadaceae bacterium]|nr:EAL domain-containing protein [Selenomonadaceae bacterium]
MPEVFPIKNFDEMLELERFRILYQPIVHVASGRICGYEALTHFVDPERGLIKPSAFIPMLEDAGLIHKLDAFMINKVCQEFHSIVEHSITPVPISINLSEFDFEHADMPSIIADALDKNALPHGALNIEIKEAAVCGARQSLIINALEKMRTLGSEIWIDHFARMMSPINVLGAFRPDLLKIDGSFLRNFHTDVYARILLKNIMNMTKEMGLRTLMIDVEDEEVVKFLHQVNCEKAQGFYYGAPEPFEPMHHLSRQPEDRDTRRYYNSIGRVNLLSQTPMQTISFDEVEVESLNQIPLAIVEFNGSKFHFLMTNESFRQCFTALGKSGDTDVEEIFNNRSLPFALRVCNTAQQVVINNDERVLDFVTGDGFSNIRLRRIAFNEREQTAALLAVVEQIGADKNREREGKKETVLRFLYTLYSRVDLLNYDAHEVENIYLNSARYKESFIKGSVSQSIKNFADRNIYGEDRQKFIDFFDVKTLDNRLWEIGTDHLTDYFRTRDGFGNFSWQMYMLIPIVFDKQRYFVCCARGIDAERMRRLPEIDRMGAEYYDMPGNPVFLLLASHAFTTTLGYGSFEQFLQNSFYVEASLTDNRILYMHLGKQGIVSKRGRKGAAYDETMRDMIINTVVEDKHEAVEKFFDRNRLLADYRVGKISDEMEFLRRPDKNDEPRYLHTTYQVREASEGNNIHVFFLSFDIDGYRRKNEQQIKLIERDTLTGLYNRGTAVVLIRKYLANSEGRRSALILLDLDNFKQINDRFGHECGDRILKDAASRMKAAFNTYGLVARIGGDEFLAMLKDVSANQTDQILKQFSDSVKSLTYHGHQITYTMSIGYAVYPNHGVEYQDLYQNADMALYAVKMNGRAHFRRFQPDMENNNRAQLGFSLAQLSEGMPGGFLVYRAREPYELLYANNQLMQLYECDSLDELRSFSGNSFRGCVVDEDWDELQQTIKNQLALSNDFDYVQFRAKTARGNVKYLENYGRLIPSVDDGDAFYVFVVDVKQKERINRTPKPIAQKTQSTEEKLIIDQLLESRRKNLLDGLFEGFSVVAEGNYVTIHDCKLNIARWSSSAVDIFNLPSEYVDASSHDWGELVNPDSRDRYRYLINALLQGELPFYEIHYRVRTKDGTYTLCTAKGVVIPDVDGRPDFICSVIKNHGIFSQVDEVTGLRNQYAFFKDLSQMMSNDQSCVILLIGIDKFTNINDMRGYNHGNHVLQEFSKLLREIFKGYNLIYRMDGTKYTIVMRNTDEEKANAIYEQLRLRLRSGFYVDAIRHNLIVNGGMIKLDRFQVSEKTVYSCLNYAHKESQETRHGELVKYQISMNESNRKALEKINVIRDSVIDGCKGFYLCYQPIVDTRTETLRAMEALLRWRGDPYGEVPPYQFVPVLEEDAIFPELGGWILRRAMIDGLKFFERYPNVIMHINLSYVQLEKEDFSDMLLRIIDELQFPPRQLCLEITEGCRLLDMDKLISIVTFLKARGISFAIDDFGTGFASIDILKRLPANVVKIDREFIRDIDKRDEDRQALKRIAELAAIFGSSVCAEGIETIEMRDIIRRYPIDTIQGFLYSKPLPFDEFMNRHFK